MLELVDLRRRYGETVALDGLSLQAQEGRLLGFVAERAGQTTAMRIALDVLEPDGGGVVEEKASRVIEVLLATVQPRSILAGKVFGIGASACSSWR